MVNMGTPPKRCPSCRRIHPVSAERCECGYEFLTGAMGVADAPKEPQWYHYLGVILGIICWGLTGLLLVVSLLAAILLGRFSFGGILICGGLAYVLTRVGRISCGERAAVVKTSAMDFQARN